MKKQTLNITNVAKPDLMMRAKLNMYIKDKYTVATRSLLGDENAQVDIDEDELEE
jgi:hypothetical protein